MTASIRHVLVPIDHSDDAQTAVDFALLVARSLGASMTLLHVSEVPSAMIAIVPGASVEGELAMSRSIAARGLDWLVEGLRARGFTQVAAVTQTGSAITPTILAWAKHHAVDLIVMATHARTGVSRLVLGSVTESVLRLAECPVLTVHLPKAP